jgi:hypothetical protein
MEVSLRNQIGLLVMKKAMIIENWVKKKKLKKKIKTRNILF